MDEKLLMIFVKNVIEGKVKTRLARSVGDEEAADIYRHLLDHTRQIVESMNCDKQVWYSAYIEYGDGWEECERKVQRGEDLGQRMNQAFREAFGSGYEKVVIIGSDCATIETPVIESAFKQLEQTEIVIGPSRDGGYYLLGMRSHHPELFKNISWSTKEVLRQTLEKIDSHGWRYALLPELNDVDTLADWREVASKFGA